MRIEKLQPGQVVWNVQRQRMGNTTVKTTSLFEVFIKEVHLPMPGELSSGWVLASWNGNTPQKFYRRTIGAWKKNKPMTVSVGMFGCKRLATREEIKEIKAKKAALAASLATGHEPVVQEKPC